MFLTRRSLTRIALLSATPSLAQREQQPPNLLFLISDDHTFHDLGCYGNTAIQTPHLDRLAREGMRFQNCFVSSPQCSPNRSSIFTGCTPHTTATSRLHSPMPEWEQSFLEPLKEKGYFTGAFRKVHQGIEFDKRWNFYGDRHTPFEKFFDAAPRNRPFFLQVGFTDPHRPYRQGAFSPPHDPAKITVPSFLPDTPEIRQDLALYHDAIARMDSECGQLFHLLSRRNLAANTFVVFTGDNGMPFPRAKGTCYDPGIHVPLIACWPGRIAPNTVRQELIAHVDLPATWLDLAGIPAPLKMQGRSFQNVLLGKPYEPRREVFSERNWHDNFDPIRSIRTERYKLIFNAAPHFPYRPPWDIATGATWLELLRMKGRVPLRPEHRQMFEATRPMIELYDLQTDPHEFHNLAADPAHAAAQEDLKRRLSTWMHATYDFLPPGHPGPNDPPGRVWPFSI